ncbi:MAG TPA: DUF3604 domain-containing protein [bacterium]|nr:DUF3604 domain-containing protein [bacterium]
MAKKAVKVLILVASLIVPLGAGAVDPWAEPLENIYWGDLHVHTSYSVDAFIGGMSPGRYADEAGMYAAYCSRLDFYSVTDHAEMLTDTNYWPESIRAAQHFSDLGAQNLDENGDPSIVAFPGWEWTRSAVYGHKNVILKDDDPARLPPTPIRFTPGVEGFPALLNKMKFYSERGGALSLKGLLTVPTGFIYGYRMGSRKDLEFVAPTPRDLFDKLRKYCTQNGSGCEALVIPHGNAWGMAPAMNTDWDIQLNPQDHDPAIQRLIETYSKHGNSEEYSYFPPQWHYFQGGAEASAEQCTQQVEPGKIMSYAQKFQGADNTLTELKPGCTRQCSEPTSSFTPCCWRAGEIVRERCIAPDSEFCCHQIELARAALKPFPEGLTLEQKNQLKPEFRAKPDQTVSTDWGDCNQCRDCWQPAVNYRNNGSVQKALANAYFDENGKPLYYRFGFIASTDTHSAWPGSVKENKRMIEPATGMVARTNQYFSDEYPGWERVDNFLNPGGLAAILAPRRRRDDLWNSLEDRNVYSTSGARIQVWARASIGDKVVRMGSETLSSKNPTFFIKANGAFVEDDTCPYDDEPIISRHFSKKEFARVCMSQCYRITDERTRIARIEVVKVLQPLNREEAKMANLERSAENPRGLIMDPYDTAQLGDEQIEWSWTDPEFVNEPPGRSVAYYFRVIQAPTPGYNCRPIALLESGKTCNLHDPPDARIEAQTNPQNGAQPKPLLDIPDPCYSVKSLPQSYCQERAWTSPFYVIRK